MQDTQTISPASLNGSQPSEQQVPEAPPQAPPQELASPKLAALAKKEAQQRRQMMQYKREAEAYKREIEGARQIRSQYEEFQRTVQTDPSRALGMIGMDYNKLTDYMINGGKFSPETKIQELDSKLQSFEQRQLEAEKLHAQRQVQAQQAQLNEALSDFKEEISLETQRNASQYPLINHYGAQDAIYKKIEDAFYKENKVLDIDEAAKLVEADIEAEIDGALTKVDKLKNKYSTGGTPKMAESNKIAPQFSEQTKTLTNQMMANSASLLPPASERDRLMRALEKLK